MKRILFFLLLICTRPGFGQTFVLIPDINFRSYLQSTIPSAMSGASLNISSPLVTTITKSITIQYQNISDLNGIQHFSSLTYLDCTMNNLTSLPTLPNSLQFLACWSNSLTTLPTLPNTLTYLDCQSNCLTSLPALPNALKILTCNSNSLTNLPTLPNSLTGLRCTDNFITSLPSLGSSLQDLLCYSNSLTSIPILPNSLNVVWCYNNNIKCFPTFPSNLNDVDIDSNPFNCLPNYVLPAMSSYTNFPLCTAGNSNSCDVVGIEELDQTNYQLSLYPNPANGQLTIDLNNSKKQTVFIYDLTGKLLFDRELDYKTNIDVSFLNEGIYNLTISIDDKNLNKKLVIVK